MDVKPTCSVEGCTTAAHRRGMCAKHWRADKNRGDCMVEGCSNPLVNVTEGLCVKHYRRLVKYGSTEDLVRLQCEDCGDEMWRRPTRRPYLCPSCARIRQFKAATSLGTRLRAYRLPEHTYWMMVAEQGGLCLICRTPNRKLVVDHCHTKGEVRGLLCNQCNVAIGLMQDSTRNLERAAAYLRVGL